MRMSHVDKLTFFPIKCTFDPFTCFDFNFVKIIALSIYILNTFVNICTFGDAYVASMQLFEQYYLHVYLVSLKTLLLSVSAHTLPPMKMLCASFITSLLSSSVSKTQSTDDRIERDETMHNDEESEESEEELSRRKSRRPTCMSLFQVLVRITGTHRIQLPIRCSLQT
ncbi:uncharacterized protein isoform X1 [Bombus fervidus]|uniref:uncharacterized protein isoform X1 n=1 Tax=Bombus fervidus TaxID=203811 RepID=UPI003D18888C